MPDVGVECDRHLETENEIILKDHDNTLTLISF